jgi:hypothetical protein
VITEWASRRDLLDSCRASCHIPDGFHPFDVVMPYKSKYSGVQYHGRELYDGAFSDPMTLYPGTKVLQISPFAGPGIDVAPADALGRFSLHVGSHRYYASSANWRRMIVSAAGGDDGALEDLVQLGYEDCSNYLERNAKEGIDT